ncbi:uncharacterized protein LOC143236671 isoform X3 [Tachypleus tridentatus]|uniref:uncharacterized protein LOC143236671 isoform X3 n=1 Tax=Tachypleus tridentatus TaxID=6853 RepID=UPI003FD5A0BE
MAASYGNITKSEGQSWSSWADNVGFKSPESIDEDDDEEANNSEKKEAGALQLKKEDMSLFGFCPALDDFFLVICEWCGKIVKPQVLKKHFEVRHGKNQLACSERASAGADTDSKVNSVKANSALSHAIVPNESSSSSVHIDMKSSVGHSASQLKPSETSLVDSRARNISKLKNAETPKPQKNHAMAPVVRVERILPDILMMKKKVNAASMNKKERLPTSSSPGGSINLVLSPVPVPEPECQSIPISVQQKHHAVVKSVPMGSSLSPTKPCVKQGGMKILNSSKSKMVPRERKLLPCKDREYDPDKHCGVVAPENGKPCTRSLTCKSHSLSLRRKVIGRKKNFDELLADHRSTKEAALRASQASPISNACDGQNGKLKLQNATNEKPVQSLSTTLINRTLVIPLSPYSRDISGSIKGSSLNCSVQRTAPAPQLKSPKAHSNKPVSHIIPQSSCRLPSLLNFGPGRPTSATSISNKQEVKITAQSKQEDTKTSALDLPFIKHHPRPAAICTFGLRQLGNGMFLLDRRWDLQRAAFRAALCTEHGGDPPPLKKLCVESQLLPVEELANSSDPYYFTCPNASSSPPKSELSSNTTNNNFVTTCPVTLAHLVSFTTVTNTSSKVSTANKSLKSKPSVSKALKTKDSDLTLSRNSIHSSSTGSGLKKKQLTGSSTQINAPNNKTLGNMRMPLLSDSVAGNSLSLSYPFTLGENIGVLSRLQTVSYSTSGRDSIFTSHSTSLQSTVTSSSSARKEESIVVKGADVVNGQLPVTSTLLHSVTINRFANSGSKLLATPGGGLGITLGGAGLIGQLSHIQNLHKSSISDHLGLVNSQSIGNQKIQASANCRTTSTNSSSNSAKSKSKIHKALGSSIPTTTTTTTSNHMALSHPLGLGLLIKGSTTGGFFAALEDINSASSNLNSHPVSLTSTSSRPLSKHESSCIVPDQTASLPNGLGPCPLDILQTATTTVNVSSLVNHITSTDAPSGLAQNTASTVEDGSIVLTPNILMSRILQPQILIKAASDVHMDILLNTEQH